MIKILLLLNLVFISLYAKNLYKEKVYQEHFCKQLGGIMEYRLEDRTRVDCLIKTHAIEVDFAKKWAESIGQSLYYASKTSRKAAVLLIMEDEKRDKKYLKRLENVSKEHGIDIWIINKDFEISFN
ncbi:hypothetical protein JHD50_06485 [Sulfurimonas sp. MAG313]|nr:hypothetical protein [Sulfurimonas sp. MAG313]MDF1880952.1 hypothetical protein [Sulfurimonas sp. MAG313]